ncbi:MULTISPECIES: LacI family DNA-binding transcriptional regulator [Pseudomonas syringae group]|uniref:LacI family transcriptional regulator n=4 Tax=Pseudomonas syringae group TaxID=136849 RepID=A0AAD0E2J4_9PSED|nr:MULTISPECIES: LacI family DNA-binding transcriptional regulator [Pseudomonas syringae group]AVB21308.1 LacI family transcriptional regulator [Pseudomonas avellanae]EGH13386.1 LacI family transcriptional regulator [Pseudomonas amygdali pv. morsprunorum str. M302280]KWS58041.1 LacI family transcriptional regulator [Pseudomonas amygdali pv. morsprunorum]PHN40620.1 LacI family transcriptional regulator [Pseudomonas avellanae]POC87914.1 LacI family transcriptional regulator [Pseudomonas avellana
MNKKKTVTISDIAKRVNMTTITVSRALSKPDLVKPATLAKILEVARELDYVPNAFARSLKRSESLIIGVITASVDNPFYSEMIKAISREAKKHGYTIMLVDTDNLEDLENSAVATLLGYRVAGIILSPVSDEPGYQPDYLDRLISGKTPVVFLDRTIHDSPFSRVVLDNYHSGLKAAQYLLAHTPAMKRLLVLTGPEHSRITVERLKGLHAVLAEHPAVQVDVCRGDYSLETSCQSTLNYLLERPAPDAIIGFNQLITLGALKALRVRNIPHGSITFCGIDRLPFADIFGVPFACVAHDAALAGSSAVRLLLDRLDNPQKSRDKVVITGELENG